MTLDRFPRFGEDARATLRRAALWARIEGAEAIGVGQLRRALDSEQPPGVAAVEYWTSDAKRALDAALRASIRRKASQVNNSDLRTVIDAQSQRAGRQVAAGAATSADEETEGPAVRVETRDLRREPSKSSESLAEKRLKLLGVPSVTDQTYTEEDARRVLQGREVAPAIADSIHNKFAWQVGLHIVEFINKKSPKLRWSPNRVLVRTLPEGESSARPLSFPDGSHAILVGQSLQESLICMANVIEYLDVAVGFSRLSFRRRKRERLGFEASARVTALLRYLILGQRMHGRLPPAPARLDRKSAEIAGKMAVGAAMFVVAHELAHVAYGHTESSSALYGGEVKITTSEVQELQADNWALDVLKQMMEADEPQPESMALWCAFIGLFATFIAEEAAYVRRSGTHPEAWERWAVLEKTAAECDERTVRLRAAFMATVAGAIKLDEPFPDHLWQLLSTGEPVMIEPAATEDAIIRWDTLQTTPLDALVAQARHGATRAGEGLLALLIKGDLEAALTMIVPSEKKRLRMLDESLALEFSSLRKAIANAPMTLAHQDQELFSVAGARLAAGALESAASHG